MLNKVMMLRYAKQSYDASYAKQSYDAKLC